MKSQHYLRPRKIALTVIFVLSLVTVASANDVMQKAKKAYADGEYEQAVALIKPLANQGNAQAQRWFGILYYRGRGVPQSYKEAAKWNRLAADQGHARAQSVLATLYYRGQGVSQNYEESARLFRLAADQGDARAQGWLATLYYRGQGVPQNYEESAKWYRLAADQGDVRAQTRLGSMYYDGQGVPQNHEESAKWYRLAADQGDVRAQRGLGFLYAYGQGVPQNYKESAKYFRLAADQGNKSAQKELATLYSNGQGVPQSSKEAARWQRLAAEQGDVEAQKNLAWYYMTGFGVSLKYDEAAKWYSLAAEQGDAEAQKKLAFLYAKGQGVTRSEQQALKWFCLATGYGQEEAMDGIIDYLEEEDDYENVVNWYFFAAEQGEAYYQVEVAKIYQFKGTEPSEDNIFSILGALEFNNYVSSNDDLSQDNTKAIKWYRLAAAQGNQEGIERLEQMEREIEILKNINNFEFGDQNCSRPSLPDVNITTSQWNKFDRRWDKWRDCVSSTINDNIAAFERLLVESGGELSDGKYISPSEFTEKLLKIHDKLTDLNKELVAERKHRQERLNSRVDEINYRNERRANNSRQYQQLQRPKLQSVPSTGQFYVQPGIQ